MEVEESTNTPWSGVPHASPGFIKDGRTINIYVDADMADRLTKAASHLGVSRSELVRVAVRTYMEDNKLWSLRGPRKAST